MSRTEGNRARCRGTTDVTEDDKLNMMEGGLLERPMDQSDGASDRLSVSMTVCYSPSIPYKPDLQVCDNKNSYD